VSDPRQERDRQLEAIARAWCSADAAEAAEGAAGADGDRIWRAAAGEASAEEVRRVALEAATEPATALAWRLARELGAGAEADEAVRRVAAAEPAFRRSPWRLWPVVAAIAAVVVAVVGLRWLAPPPGPPPAWRTGEPGHALIEAGEEGATKPRGSFTLRWRADVAPGARYTVRVTTSDLTPVFEAADLLEATATVPESALAVLPDGATLYWQVEARTPDGRVLTSSTTSAVVSGEPRGPGEDPRAREGGTR
jgi:hypothetical protein